ncbi:hypothetical protein [Chryseobacterium mucoviscidosis]|nr:hypothetical protein [Chryseobacterium mucoviscidosis]
MNTVAVLLGLLLCIECKRNEQKIVTEKSDQSHFIKDSLPYSPSLKSALTRIKSFDDGKGSDVDVINNFRIEENSWKEEIENIYLKLHEKIRKNDPESLSSLEKYHESWKNYLESYYSFKRNFLSHYIYSKQWIFYVFPKLRQEYKDKLIEYYELYEFDKY